MNRMQNEAHLYYRTLLADTFGTVIKVSQWFLIVPYPLYPYQEVTSASQQRFCVLSFLKKLLSLLIVVAMVGALVQNLFFNAKAVYIYSVPTSIKIMYYIQTILQLSCMLYILFVFQFRTSFHRNYFDSIWHVLEQFGRRDIDVGLRKVKRTNRTIAFITAVQIVSNITTFVMYTTGWGQLVKIFRFLFVSLSGRANILVYMTMMSTVEVLLRQMNDTLESFLHPTPKTLSIQLKQPTHITTDDRRMIEKIRLLQLELMRVVASTNADRETLGIQLKQPIRLTADDRRMIEKIRLLQLELMRVVAKTNAGEFGAILAVSFVSTFFHINTEFLQLYQGVRQNTISLTMIFLRLINCAFRFSAYIMIAYSNRMVQKQNLRARSVLHKLNNMDNDMNCSHIIVSGVTSLTVVLMQFYDAIKD
ncbi:AGAP006874-PA-like protein [Anopheles sinensis]|uniref:Gustatory receptor n=1 Tax=Anopheles sinensis TaxID=74873 RepID=A0A084W697_ANOSI|nr:AGAP006874-PA-like protein [Anopheles sinensis]